MDVMPFLGVKLLDLCSSIDRAVSKPLFPLKSIPDGLSISIKTPLKKAQFDSNLSHA
jgi:hypothetical protein